MGDLGTLIPLLVALARQRSIFLAPALFLGGLANVVTGFAWDVPMCVQPMKSIAAVALTDGLTQAQVTAAGVWMGIFMTILGATSLIEAVNKIVPSAVVSGLQVGVGLNLTIRALEMLATLTFAKEPDCLLLAFLMGSISLYLLRERDSGSFHPVGIYLFLMGCLLAIVKLMEGDGLPLLQVFHPEKWSPVVQFTIPSVTKKDWMVGLLEGALPQLPLTTLNSVISVCSLAQSLYPSNHLSRKDVSISVGIMNLLLCPLGGMPNCHGAGGLAGQHRFGARHGTSVVVLGCFKMLLAVLFGASALSILDALPISTLGVMLSLAGLELTVTGLLFLATQENLRQKAFIAFVTSSVIVGLHKTHYGALCGMVAYLVYGDGFEKLWNWTWNNRTSDQSASKGLLTNSGEANEDCEVADQGIQSH